MCPCTGHGNNSTCAAGAAAADGDDIVLLDQYGIPDAIVSVELDRRLRGVVGWLIGGCNMYVFVPAHHFYGIIMVMLMETNLLQVHPWTGRQEPIVLLSKWSP
jgi:hypothetical protein